MSGRLRVICALVVAACCGIAQAAESTCVPTGQWVVPASAVIEPLAHDQLLERAAASDVVLLGEIHDQAEHHRWQLHMMSALHALRGQIVLGFEMFPRRVQPVLDRWVAGELTEAQFLEQSDWRNVWGFETALYLPLFHFARMHRVPMVALNVERSVVRAIGRAGAAAVSEAMREGVGRPESVPEDYESYLFEVFLQHDRGKAKASRDAPAFRRFLESQSFWDRAMAEGIRTARERFPEHQVIGIMGGGHTLPGAVPHQLRALGVANVMVLRPWNADADCAQLSTRIADAVFGLTAREAPAQASARPRLGVVLRAAEGGGVRIDQVVERSIASQAGLEAGDVVLTIAGVKAATTGDVVAAISRQAPGTWLPLRIRRGDGEIDIVAKFPPTSP